MSANSPSLESRLIQEGFRPGAKIKHKKTGVVVEAGRIEKGRVYSKPYFDRYHTQDSKLGFVHDFVVVEPNFHAAPDHWGQHPSIRPAGLYRRW